MLDVLFRGLEVTPSNCKISKKICWNQCWPITLIKKEEKTLRVGKWRGREKFKISMIKLGSESKENSLREIETEAKARHQRKVSKLSLSFFVYVLADESWREGKNLEWEYHCVCGRVGASFLCVYCIHDSYNSEFTRTSHQLKDELYRRHFLYTTLILLWLKARRERLIHGSIHMTSYCALPWLHPLKGRWWNITQTQIKGRSTKTLLSSSNMIFSQ
jgi:hypothetical protein